MISATSPKRRTRSSKVSLFIHVEVNASQDPQKSVKTVQKGKDELAKDEPVKKNNNILLENPQGEDTDSEIGSPKFKKNDIKQEEIEGQMFVNPIPKREKNKVKAK
jgi:hypothetical protein